MRDQDRVLPRRFRNHPTLEITGSEGSSVRRGYVESVEYVERVDVRHVRTHGPRDGLFARSPAAPH